MIHLFTTFKKFGFGIFLLGLYLLPFGASASLNGTNYTIDASKAASSTNYKTFASAVSDLVSGTRSDGGTANGSGVTGKVVFTVANGSYNEQISISAISGASSSNTITFTGNSTDSSKVILYYAAGSTNDYTLDLNGANWITFKKMTISRTGSGTPSTVVTLHGACNNQFLNCHFIGQMQASTSSNFTQGPGACIESYGADTNNLYQYNHFTYGLHGIWINSGGSTYSGNKILNNIIDTAGSCGVYADYQSGLQIIGNTINQGPLSSSFSPYVSYTIRIENSGGFKVLKNYLFATSTASTVRAIVMFYPSSSSTDHGIIANNYIVMTGGSSTSTAIASAVGTYVDIVYNTIIVNNSSLSTASVLYLYTSSSGYSAGTNYVVENNIMINKGGGVIYDLQSNVSAFSTIDYNDLYSTGKIGYWNSSTLYNTLSDWQSGSSMDANSKSVNVTFNGTNDPHHYTPALKGAGTPLSNVKDDIDGQKRSTTRPDIGADEMVAPKYEAGIIGVVQQVFCVGTANLSVRLHNFASDTLRSVKINWTMGGTTQTPYSWTGKIAPDSTKTVTIGSYNFSSSLTMQAWTSGPNGGTDAYQYNDSTTANITVSKPTATVGTSQTICAGSPIMLGGPSVTGNVYKWTSKPAGFTSSISNPTVSPTVNTTYYLTETNSVAGCTKSDSVKISVAPLPAANVGKSHSYSICLGSSVSLGDKPVTGNTYSWTSLGFSSTSSSVTVTPTTAGIKYYILTETITATKCSKSDTVVITVNPLPVANVGTRPTKAYCPGTKWVLGSTAVSGNTYTWTSIPTGFTSTKAKDSVYPTVTTTYYLTETVTATGCSKSDSVTVVIAPTPSANVGTIRSVCLGRSATIGSTAVTGNTYAWTSRPAGFTSTLSNPVISPTVNTTYILKETNSAGCFKTDSVRITVLPKPAPIVTGSGTVCSGKTTVYRTKVTAGNSYNWRVKGGTMTTFSDFDSIRVTWKSGSGWVSISETNSSGCTDSAFINVTANPTPVAAFTAPSGCLGDITLITNTATGASSYSWNFGDGGTSGSSNPSHTYTSPGVYKITQTARSAAGCSDTISHMVRIGAVPVSTWTTKHGAGRSYKFSPADTTRTTYAWDFNDGGTSNLTKPTHTFASDGNYAVKLTVSDANGCSTSYDSILSVTVNSIQSKPALVNQISIYPNPFRQDLVIDYQLNARSTVSISIYDVTGREIGQINKGIQPAGHFTVDWNSAAGVKPGLYLVRITADDMVFTRQVMKVE